MPPCPYTVLRVPRDASHPTIRSAYKSRSLALHPDKNPSAPPNAFPEAQAAYTSIATPAARAAHDASTRAVYTAKDANDPFGDDAVRRAFATQIAAQLGEEEGDMFESLFGETRAAMGGGSGSADSNDHPVVEDDLPPWKPPDVEVDLHVSLDDLFGGCTKRRRVRKKVLDEATGAYVDGSAVLDIVLRPGYRPGDRVRFPEAGDHAPGTLPPDVVFVVVARPHARFALLENGDLKFPVHVSLADALAGALVRIPSLGGSDAFSVRTTDIITPGQIRRVKGRGMPSPDGDSLPSADLLIAFVVDFPKTLTPADKASVRALLAPAPATPDIRPTSKSFASPKRSRSVLPLTSDGLPRGASERKAERKKRTSSLANDASPPHLSLKSLTSQASLRRSRSRASASRASFHDTGPTAASTPNMSTAGWRGGRSASRREHERALSRQGTFDNRRQGKPVLPQTDSDSDSDSVDADQAAPSRAAQARNTRSFVAPRQERRDDDDDDGNGSVISAKPRAQRKKGWLNGWMGL